MAYKCENCDKGVVAGHNVSHAKNRTRRLFKPNLQKLKVNKNGIFMQVMLCTSCIKRLRKDGRTGIFSLKKTAVETPLKETKVDKIPEKKSAKKALDLKKTEKLAENRETLNLSDIIGKK